VVTLDPRAFAAVRAEADGLARVFTSAGHQLFLVGGIVRDLVLGEPLTPATDLDFATSARPDHVRELVAPLADAVWDQGARFGTVACLVEGRHVEITTFRSEVYVQDSRKPHVAFADDVATDLARRDFTVNAMALDMASGALVDPFDGIGDLARRVLATPLGPEIAFSEDPLRMLRAARFVAGYALVPAPGVVAAMTALAPRLAIVSAERIRDELDKLLSVPAAAAGFGLLSRAGLLDRVLPGVDDARISSLDAVAADPTIRCAVLLAEQDPAAVRSQLRALRHSSARVDATLSLVEALAQLGAGALATDEALRRATARFGPVLDQALVVGPAAGLVPASQARAVRSRQQDLAADLADLTLPLDGRDVMRLLGLAPGPEVGRALDAVAEWRYRDGPLDAATARERLLAWAAGSG
jgi:poly(A) polymerase